MGVTLIRSRAGIAIGFAPQGDLQLDGLAPGKVHFLVRMNGFTATLMIAVKAITYRSGM
jgi:hypothetical protein